LEKKCPDLVIIDRNLKLKKNLKLFNNMKYRKILLVTCKNDSKKISFFKSRGLKIIKVGQLNLFKDYKNLFFKLKKKYSRILVEAGLNFTNFLIKNELIKNIYIFQSFYKLKNQGTNNSSPNIIKKIKLKNQISVNLFGDQIYKEKI
jgi:Pyrimidine reductase, riboflavin biosynthesis